MRQRTAIQYIGLVLALVLSTGSTSATPIPISGPTNSFVYLPLVTTEPLELYGHVTYQDQPIAGIVLGIVSCGPSPRGGYLCGPLDRRAVTDAHGLYNFTNLASIRPGEGYYQVTYSSTSLGDSLPNTLATWQTAPIFAYTAGSTVNAGDIDIASIAPVTPASGTALQQPRNTTSVRLDFAWTPRKGHPEDNYELLLGNFSAESSGEYSSGFLGYTGTYSATFNYGTTCEVFCLVPVLRPDRVYQWRFWIDSPIGMGLSRPFTFTLPLQP